LFCFVQIFKRLAERKNSGFGSGRAKSIHRKRKYFHCGARATYTQLGSAAHLAFDKHFFQVELLELELVMAEERDQESWLWGQLRELAWVSAQIELMLHFVL
jgi:hypothetical protein